MIRVRKKMIPLVFLRELCYTKPDIKITRQKERERNDMTKHIILWKLKSDLTEDEKKEVKKGIKEGLEGLAGKIPGLLSIHVQTEGLPSSNADLMLDSAFESAAALRGYSVHPAHVEVANGRVRPYTELRCCFDYEMSE